MSDTVKLVIEIPKLAYKACRELRTNNDDGIIGLCAVNAIADGIPLDDVKAEISRCKTQNEMQLSERDTKGKLMISDIYCRIIEVLDNIGEAESEE